MKATHARPQLSLSHILQMNLGFLGLQFSFGLQQSNMAPIYRYLGADEAAMPLLWLAGPMTGLLVQPLVGAMSDRTQSRIGRRTPYFLVGAVLCSLCLLAMPYSSVLWAAVCLLWVLDAANNITMGPYRAYVADRLPPHQQSLGYLSQSAFTGLAQTFAYLAPSLFVWWGVSIDAVDANGIPAVTRIAFLAGAGIALATLLWSVWRVPELPIEVAARPSASSLRILGDLFDALVAMPSAMRQLGLAMLFQWYAMFAYWQYVALALARSLHDTADPASPGFREAVLVSGQLGAFYNFIAFVAAFAMVSIARALGAKTVHAACLAAAGAAMLLVPSLDRTALFVPMIGIGVGWASMMGNPYAMLASSIPPERNGIYMGIFNMFIVVPMLLESLTMWLIYRPLLGGDPRNVVLMAGGLMLAASVATMAVRLPRAGIVSGA